MKSTTPLFLSAVLALAAVGCEDAGYTDGVYPPSSDSAGDVDAQHTDMAIDPQTAVSTDEQGTAEPTAMTQRQQIGDQPQEDRATGSPDVPSANDPVTAGQ